MMVSYVSTSRGDYMVAFPGCVRPIHSLQERLHDRETNILILMDVKRQNFTVMQLWRETMMKSLLDIMMQTLLVKELKPLPDIMMKPLLDTFDESIA